MLWGKRLEVLAELLPADRRRLAVLNNPSNPGHARNLTDIAEQAPRLGFTPRILDLTTPAAMPAYAAPPPSRSTSSEPVAWKRLKRVGGVRLGVMVLDGVLVGDMVALGVTDWDAPRVSEVVGVAVEDGSGDAYAANSHVSWKAPVTPWLVRGAHAGTST